MGKARESTREIYGVCRKKKEEQSQQFQQESYELRSDKENFDTDFENGNLDVDAESAENEQNLSSCSKKRRHSYIAVPEDENDPLPSTVRYIRTSEKKVRDKIFLALTDLLGIGLSSNEALQAVVIVSSRVFGRSFHIASTTADGTLEPIKFPPRRKVSKGHGRKS